MYLWRNPLWSLRAEAPEERRALLSTSSQFPERFCRTAVKTWRVRAAQTKLERPPLTTPGLPCCQSWTCSDLLFLSPVGLREWEPPDRNIKSCWFLFAHILTTFIQVTNLWIHLPGFPVFWQQWMQIFALLPALIWEKHTLELWPGLICVFALQ